MNRWSVAPCRQRSKNIIERLRHYPVTTAVTMITLAVGTLALLIPRLVTTLEQDPQVMVHGQWWRSLSPMLVQGYGLGQFLFNLLGIVLVGSAVEARYGWWRWLVVYASSGVSAILLTLLWFPQKTDSGSSAAVAGLIGALVVSMVHSGPLPPWPSMLYGVFFAVYVSALALGPIVGSVAGSIVIPVFVLTRMRAGTRVLRIGVLAVIFLATVAMLIGGDANGVGLAIGMITAVLLRPLSAPARGGSKR
jgi:membrane associated rhomboid family serine protease